MGVVMEFWGPAAVMALLVAGGLALALMRSRRGGAAIRSDVAMYRDQLAELDRDLARGVLSEEDAAAVRLEVSRRLLDADRRAAAQSQNEGRGSTLFGAILGLLVLGVAGGLYWQLGARNYPDMGLADRLAAAEDFRATRPGQAEMVARIGAVQIDPGVPQENIDLIDRLRDALKSRPNDLTGHAMLAQNEAQLGRFTNAAEAQAQVLRIKGNAATGTDYSDYAEMLILAAGGYVSPEAEIALAKALELDPRDPIAIYYTGLMFAQIGRPDRALLFWRPLLEESPSDAPWVPAIEQQIGQVAADAGVAYSPPSRAPGPSREDVAAAAEMSEADRQAMIEGMVAQLSDRLATEGGPPEDWARLINALGVLERPDQAREIYLEALSNFGELTEARAMLDNAARSAGVLE